MVTDLEQLGPPETDSGTEVKSELDELGTQLTEQVDTIKQAFDSNAGALSQASIAAAAFSTMANDVSTTWDSVKNLDPGGELAGGLPERERLQVAPGSDRTSPLLSPTCRLRG